MTPPTTHTAPEAAWPPESAGPSGAAQSGAAPPVATAAEPACANCSTPLVGDYCHGCGQRAAHPDDLSVRRFVASMVHELVDLDSRLLTTLRTLVLRPGQLTVDFLEGRRGRYLSPFKIFLIVTALYFVVAWAPSLEMQNFEQQLRASPTFAAVGATDAIATPAFIDSWLERAGRFAAYARFANLVGCVGMVALVFNGRRSFAGHLVYAMHYYTFAFLIGILVVLPFVAIHALTGKWGPTWAMFGTIPAQAWYAYASARRAYGQPRGTTLGKSMAIVLGDSVFSLMSFTFALGMAFAATHAATQAAR